MPNQPYGYNNEYDTGYENEGGLWASIKEAFVDLFFDEVDDDRPIGLSRLSHQTFRATPQYTATQQPGDVSLPPRQKQQQPTGNIFADGLNNNGQFVQPRNQFYKNAGLFSQDFRYERLAGQKAKPQSTSQEYY